MNLSVIKLRCAEQRPGRAAAHRWAAPTARRFVNACESLVPFSEVAEIKREPQSKYRRAAAQPCSASRIMGAVLAAFCLTAPLAAQDTATLADVRSDLTALYAEIEKLKGELTQSQGSGTTIGGSTYDRVVSIEGELQRLTGKVEALEFRIGQVVRDGTRRIGDLEFRLCELEPACDIGTLGETPSLGGEAATPAPAVTPAPSAASGGDGELAVGERFDFDAASGALEEGDFRSAADMFKTFRETYPRGPLESAALLGEGQALAGLGDTREAARRYLRAYSDFPDSEAAPEALWRLGEALAALGSTAEACVTLAEVSRRYPAASQMVTNAQASLGKLTCP